MRETVDNWQDEESGNWMSLSRAGETLLYHGMPEDGGHRWQQEAGEEVPRRHARLVRELGVANHAGHLGRENDELARGILELQRKLTIAEKRTAYAEDRLQSAINLGEMWWGRYEKKKAEVGYYADVAMAAAAREAYLMLPLAYFPAGEVPDARWGLTDLGQRVLSEGWARGPEWTLLVSPDPREVLSIEVRAGSRQEEIYRAAGYVTADEPAIHGVHFLGLLEAFGEVAAAEDEALGRAMRALEGLYIFFQHEKAAELLCRMKAEVTEALYGQSTLERGDLVRFTDAEACASGRRLPAYDLAAVCARCGGAYQQHLGLGSQHIPCDGFLAKAGETIDAEHEEAPLMARVDPVWKERDGEVCPECDAVGHGNMFCNTCRTVNNARYGWDLPPYEGEAVKPCGAAEVEAFARRVAAYQPEEDGPDASL